MSDTFSQTQIRGPRRRLQQLGVRSVAVVATVLALTLAFVGTTLWLNSSSLEALRAAETRVQSLADAREALADLQSHATRLTRPLVAGLLNEASVDAVSAQNEVPAYAAAARRARATWSSARDSSAEPLAHFYVDAPAEEVQKAVQAVTDSGASPARVALAIYWADRLNAAIARASMDLGAAQATARAAVSASREQAMRRNAMLSGLASLLVISAALYGWLLWRQLREALHQHERLVSQLAAASVRDSVSRLELTRQAIELRKLSAVAERTGNAVVITDAEGRIEWVNESFERQTGYSFAEARGRRPGDFLQGVGTDESTRQRIRAAIAAREPIEVEMLNYARDGHEFWVRIDLRPVLDDAGRVSHYLSVQTDISAQKSIETQLKRARDMAMAAAHTRGQFIANTSHEIRTPMNGILGMAELLLRTKLDERQRRHAECILRSGRHLLSLLNDVLDISKMEAGRFELDQRPADLAQTAREAIAVVRESARAKSLAIDWRVEPDYLPPLVFDGVRLRQVLVNLLGNAIKFTERGSVTLEVHAAVADGVAHAQVSFAVKDTGVGIAADIQPHIFEPFVQGTAGVAATHGGTGLGLAISRQLVRLMKGELVLASTPGVGSCFSFELTLALAAAADLEPDMEVPLRALGLRVLVAEDFIPNQHVMIELLEALDCSAVVVEHGRAAVERYTAAPDSFDVVLMDCRMPLMDGFEAALAIRRWEQNAGRPRIPIVAVTAGAFALERQRCFDAGMDGFVAKPITLAELLGTLVRACSVSSKRVVAC